MLAEIIFISGNSLQGMVKHFLFILPAFINGELVVPFLIIYICYIPFTLIENFAKKKSIKILFWKYILFSILYVFIFISIGRFFNFKDALFNFLYLLVPINELIIYCIMNMKISLKK